MAEDATSGPFRDAEAWLEERGVERDPLVTEAQDDEPEEDEPEPEPALGDEVAKAVAYVRRATAKTPFSEQRLRGRLEDRGLAPATIEQALERCRNERLVDDAAFAAALVDEGRRKGHAPLRIRTDLERRELSAEAIEDALAAIGDRDEEAAAYAVAAAQARRLRSVDPETAYRRLVGFLARRGYTQGLARKVARQAVFHDREPQRTAER